MDINIRHLFDPSQVARTAAAAQTAINNRPSDPYYTASNGTFAAKVVAAWKSDGWKAQHIRHGDLHISSRSLTAKIRGGIEWNAYHADTTEHQNFWAELRRDVRFRKKDANTITIYRESEPDFVMTRAGAESFNMQLRTQLISWAQTAKPGAKFHKVALDLGEDDVSWFQRKLDEPAWAETFVGFAKPNEIRVIRTEAPIKDPIVYDERTPTNELQ